MDTGNYFVVESLNQINQRNYDLREMKGPSNLCDLEAFSHQFLIRLGIKKTLKLHFLYTLMDDNPAPRDQESY